MKIATFMSSCGDCNNIFELPLLSDFSYGEFIVKEETGQNFAFISANNNEGWETVSSLFEGLTMGDNRFDRECFQWVIGKCLNPIDDSELNIVDHHVCPKCLSQNIRYDLDEKVGEVSLQEASFSSFLALPEIQQKQKIQLLLEEWQSSLKT